MSKRSRAITKGKKNKYSTQSDQSEQEDKNEEEDFKAIQKCIQKILTSRDAVDKLQAELAVLSSIQEHLDQKAVDLNENVGKHQNN